MDPRKTGCEGGRQVELTQDCIHWQTSKLWVLLSL